MLASMDALSGGSTGPSPEMSRGPFRRLPPGHGRGVGDVDLPGHLEGDAERAGLLGGVGALVEQLGRRQSLGLVLAAAVAATAAGEEPHREREDGERGEEAAGRARHGRGIAWPAMRGRPDGT